RHPAAAVAASGLACRLGPSLVRERAAGGCGVDRRQRAMACRLPLRYAARGHPMPATARGGANVEDSLAELDRTASASALLGYLNFSDGRPDVRWQKQLHDACAVLLD